jgi:hypothetical protein
MKLMAKSPSRPPTSQETIDVNDADLLGGPFKAREKIPKAVAISVLAVAAWHIGSKAGYFSN